MGQDIVGSPHGLWADKVDSQEMSTSGTMSLNLTLNLGPNWIHSQHIGCYEHSGYGSYCCKIIGVFELLYMPA